MLVRISHSVLGTIVLLCTTAAAADLSRIERTIRKQPAYQSKQPKYCLLVCGPDAKTRVWLVQDGGILYVDRNGNGDLTEPGEKVAAEKADGLEEGEYNFNAGDISDGGASHKELYLGIWKLARFAEQDEDARAAVAKNPLARAYRINLQVAMPPWKGAGIGGRVQQRVSQGDTRGWLQFGDRPQDAPIIHFGGPWQIMLNGRLTLTIGRNTDAFLGVGTPGLGPGTTAYIDYAGVIPEEVYPVFDLTYAAKQPGEPPVRERYDFKQRC
jgi:hypothetical protein